MRVGLTGGIASGKSTVSALLAVRGAIVVDHDVLAREAVAPGTPGLRAIGSAFGPSVLTADGSLDRAALGAIVFADSAKLDILNSIVHPEVKRLAQLADQNQEGHDTVIIHDIPLLVETTQQHDFDAVIVVEAPYVTRIARMQTNRGMSAQDAEARIAQQADDSARRAIADYVIVNDGSLAEVEEQVDRVWHDLISAAKGGARA